MSRCSLHWTDCYRKLDLGLHITFIGLDRVVHTPCTLPLDPPLHVHRVEKVTFPFPTFYLFCGVAGELGSKPPELSEWQVQPFLHYVKCPSVSSYFTHITVNHFPSPSWIPKLFPQPHPACHQALDIYSGQAVKVT